MSRVGKVPIPIPKGVKIRIESGRVHTESAKGKLTTNLPQGIRCESRDETLLVLRRDDTRQQRAFHGLTRSLIRNAVQGLSEGFKKELEIIGIGYKAQASGNKLVLNIGYSKPVEFQIPEGVDVKVEKQTRLLLSSVDKQLLGQVSAEIRDLRPPEPYKGKGIRYKGEEIRRKAGKAGKAGTE